MALQVRFCLSLVLSQFMYRTIISPVKGFSLTHLNKGYYFSSNIFNITNVYLIILFLYIRMTAIGVSFLHSSFVRCPFILWCMINSISPLFFYLVVGFIHACFLPFQYRFAGSIIVSEILMFCVFFTD